MFHFSSPRVLLGCRASELHASAAFSVCSHTLAGILSREPQHFQGGHGTGRLSLELFSSLEPPDMRCEHAHARHTRTRITMTLLGRRRGDYMLVDGSSGAESRPRDPRRLSDADPPTVTSPPSIG